MSKSVEREIVWRLFVDAVNENPGLFFRDDKCAIENAFYFFRKGYEAGKR